MPTYKLPGFDALVAVYIDILDNDETNRPAHAADPGTPSPSGTTHNDERDPTQDDPSDEDADRHPFAALPAYGIPTPIPTDLPATLTMHLIPD